MKKTTKVWLITGVSLILIGCILFAGIMIFAKWDLSKISSVSFKENTYNVDNSFDNISLNSFTADVTFLLSDDGKCKVECYEEENITHSVEVIENTLQIKTINNKSWYDQIGFLFDTPRITVYLPKNEFKALTVKNSTGNIDIPKDLKFESADISLSTGNAKLGAAVSEQAKIKTSTGDIRIEDTTAGSLELKTSTGKVTLSNVTCREDINLKVSTGNADLTDIKCKNLNSEGTTGNLTLNKIIAQDKFTIKRSTGIVRFLDSDAAEITVKTNTGDVMGNLLTEKVFITETSTGDVNVPKTATGGKCEIKTDTGNIKIKTN